MDVDGLCNTYFRLGMSNTEIRYALSTQHRIVISNRTLKRITARYGLYRRKNLSDILDVAMFIEKECRGSGACHGYRWMHAKCKRNGLLVAQKTVMLLLKIIEPQCVKERLCRRLRRRMYSCAGPDALWHIDGNDKLKPFGISIHGCIDGFSRQVIWMEVMRSNSNPWTIADCYLQALKMKGGCPERIRADRGTENTYVRQMQIFLRSSHVDRFSGINSFLYGRSTANQRIECWWGILRKQCLDFWIDLFKQLQADGHFEGDFLDRNLVQFCFLAKIQADVDAVVETWNSHRIRRTPNTLLPCGRPILMYAMPEIYGAEAQLRDLDEHRVELCQREIEDNTNPRDDKVVFDLCTLTMAEMHWDRPQDPHEICDLYLNLRREIRSVL